MLKCERTSVMNIENAIRGARNPMNSWDRADSYYDEEGNYQLGPNDMNLARRLRLAGSDHRKFIRQIFVSVDITAPLYWWKEFSIEDFSHDHLTEEGLESLKRTVEDLERIRLRFLEKKNKEDWYTIIQLLPSSYQQMRTCTMNYESLINMYFSRKSHKLEEWHTFCDWIQTLPYAKELILAEKELDV